MYNASLGETYEQQRKAFKRPIELHWVTGLCMALAIIFIIIYTSFLYTKSDTMQGRDNRGFPDYALV